MSKLNVILKPSSSDLTQNSTDSNFDTECYRELVALAGRKFGSIPAEVLAEHVIKICSDVDWVVRREAMLALHRRYLSVHSEELCIAKRPEGRNLLGEYKTKIGSDVKPYRTILKAVNLISCECDCADYLRSSLGICKHIFVLLDFVYSESDRLKKCEKEQAEFDNSVEEHLSWVPIRPALGLGDWMERIYWHNGQDQVKQAKVVPAFMKYFKPCGEACCEIKRSYLNEQSERLNVCNAILRYAEQNENSSPSLLAMLKEEKTKLYNAMKDNLSSEQVVKYLNTLKKKLYPYQIEGVQRFISVERLLLADDMGLGKTIQAIASSHVLFKSGKIKKGLLVVPAALKAQWSREWAMFSDVPITIIDCKPEERKQIYENMQQGFLITNYEQVLKDLVVIHEWQPDFIILDEAQRIKNWATKTAVFIKKLKPRWKLVLTGTPMENRLIELASIVEWVDSHALEPKWRLIPWHTSYIDGREEVGGARNLDVIRTRLAHCMIRRVREEVLSQLPPRTDTRVPVMMTEVQIEEHSALSEPILRLMRIGSKRPLTQREFLKLMSLLQMQRMISNGMAQVHFEDIWEDISAMNNPTDEFLRSLDSPKLLEFRELISQVVISQKQRAVVFSQWTRMLALAHWSIKGMLEEAGVKAVFFTGKEKQKRRTQNIIDFHDDDRVCILFASDAGGVGLNLQRAANCCINLDLPWNPAVLEQRIGRVYRLGQSSNVSIYNLINECGIEARIASLVGNKRALFKGLFDSETNEIIYEQGGSFMGQLEKLVEPVIVPELKAMSFENEEVQEVERQEEIEDLQEVEELSDALNDEIEVVESSEQEQRPNASQTGILGGLSIEKTSEGEIKIKAKPETISTLVSLFEGLAVQLRGVM